MPCSISVTKEDGYIRVRVAGDVALANAKLVATTAHEAAGEHGCDRILVDAPNVRVSLNTVDLFSLGEFLAAVDPRGGRKTALLVPAETLQPDRFLEQVARNRGIYLKVFADAAEAVAWLTEG
jgi:hypothetical protein